MNLVRCDGGTEYEEWLDQLAAASGIETPTRADLAKLDRKRPGKGSNKDWEHPHDPEARIKRMRDGRTRLAHKLEQAVDLETGAVVATTVQTTGGGTASLPVTLDEAERRLAEAGVEAEEVVADKGYHSNRTMTDVRERAKRSYVSEPDRGRRRWKGKRDAQRAVYANRRRIRGHRGKRLLRRRGETVERAFAHTLETGGLRRVHVRGQEEIRKTDACPGRGLQPRPPDAEEVRLGHSACPAGPGPGAGRARGPRHGRGFGPRSTPSGLLSCSCQPSQPSPPRIRAVDAQDRSSHTTRAACAQLPPPTSDSPRKALYPRTAS